MIYLIIEDKYDYFIERLFKSIYAKKIIGREIDKLHEKGSELDVIEVVNIDEKGNRRSGFNFIENKLKLVSTKIRLPMNKSTNHTILIFADADNDVNVNFNKIVGFLKKFDLPYPLNAGEFASKDNITLGVFLFPNNKDRGEVETLMYDALIDNDKIKDEIAKITFKHNDKPDKRKLQIYLALEKDFETYVNTQILINRIDYTWYLENINQSDEYINELHGFISNSIVKSW